MPHSLPAGRYLSAMGAVRADKGGQTGAMLLRSRVIGSAIGSPVDVVCFDHSRMYPEIRLRLQETGLLRNGMRLLNLFEYYRDNDWPEADPDAATTRAEGVIPSRADPGPTRSGAGWETPPDLIAEQITQSDGTPWLISYRDSSGTVVLHDFQRRDGSVYLRGPAFKITDPIAAAGCWTRVGRDGQIIGVDADARQLFQRFLTDLTAADRRAFVIVDSRYLAPLLAPIDDPTIHLLYLLHNCHAPPPRRWDTPVPGEYGRLLDKMSDLDAFVTLTSRQADDIQRQWGPRPNIFVVPNPVDSPLVPEPLPVRDPLLVSVVARLERQKRLRHAVLVMEKVIRKVPGARLDIWGTGSQRDDLQDLIVARGLTDSIRLRGHDPAARDTLWRSSAFLLTSEKEGYPLATLESLARGCPVVSYDVAYGPCEQITEGRDGYLVEPGDLAGAARRVTTLLRSPDLVRRMSASARATAAEHGEDRFLQDWAAVVHAVIEQAPHRVRLREVAADVAVQGPDTIARRVGWAPKLTVSAHLRIRADGPGADPTAAVVELVAVDSRTGATTTLPARSTGSGGHAHVSAVVDPHQVFAGLPAAAHAYVQLRLRWHNAYWATTLRTRHVITGAFPSFADGRLRLSAPLSRRARVAASRLPHAERTARRLVRRVSDRLARQFQRGV